MKKRKKLPLVGNQGANSGLPCLTLELTSCTMTNTPLETPCSNLFSKYENDHWNIKVRLQDVCYR